MCMVIVRNLFNCHVACSNQQLAITTTECYSSIKVKTIIILLVPKLFCLFNWNYIYIYIYIKFQAIPNVFKKVTLNVKLTFEEVCTFLTQIEACLNSQPLVVLSSDDDCIDPRTLPHRSFYGSIARSLQFLSINIHSPSMAFGLSNAQTFLEAIVQ